MAKDCPCAAKDRPPYDPCSRNECPFMTADRPGPAFSVQDIPFSTYGSWFDISPVVAEKTYAEDLHLVSHQNGMHAVLSLTPLDRGATGERAGTRVEATPGLLSWIGVMGLTASTSPTSRRTPYACAARHCRCASVRRPAP